VILNKPVVDFGKLDKFTEEIEVLRANGCWEKSDILKLFYDLLPSFDDKETGKFLDQKM
jgi:hypothetical protein